MQNEIHEFQKCEVAKGVELAYVVKGQGRPVVFVHGGVSDLRTWSFQMERFSQQYLAIAYSRRSHYPNPFVEYGPDYSTNVEVEDLVALIEHLGLSSNSVTIVGSSRGGSIAAFAALRHPGLVRNLVLCEPGLFNLLADYPGFDSGRAAFKNALDQVKQKFEVGDLEGGARIFWNLVMGADVTFEQIPPELRMRILQNARTIPEDGESLPFSRDDARNIVAPTLLVSGEKSPQNFQFLIEELSRCLPSSEKVVIKGASHGMHFQNPEAFNEAVLSFIAKH